MEELTEKDIEMLCSPRADEAAAVITRAAQFSCAERLYPLKRVGTLEEGRLFIEETELAGNSIRKHLAGCGSAIVLSGTLGHAADRAIERLKVTDLELCVLCDYAALILIERCLDRFCENLKNKYSALGAATSRFSCGYGDVPLSLQPAMLKMSGGDKIGIRLTDSMIMSPRKSVTAVVGIMPAFNIEP